MIVIYQHTDTKCIADNTFPSKQREIKYINIAKKGFNYEHLCRTAAMSNNLTTNCPLLVGESINKFLC